MSALDTMKLSDFPYAGESNPENLEDPANLFNRELSWLEFNRRVLDLALDNGVPLLERLKFLSIFSTNLDEFFMIRVSGLKEQVSEGIVKPSVDGRTAEEQLKGIREVVRSMVVEQMFCLNEQILPALEEEGISIVSYSNLPDDEQSRLNEYFNKNIFPILTPQAVDESHPFPYISSRSVNIGVNVKPEKGFSAGIVSHLFNESRFVRIKLPPMLSRLIPIQEGATRFALLEDIIGANISTLFPQMRVKRPQIFRLTRDADIEIREDEAGDLLRTMERELLLRRRSSFAVRLEVESTMSEKITKYLAGSIGLIEDDIYRINGFVNIPDLMQLYGIDRPELKDAPISYSIPSPLKNQDNIFDVLKKQDVLIHHPYNSYSVITDFLAAAAEDEDVCAIKICLYRTGINSPIVESLSKASRNGKQVAALVELKARFDEENNIEWARKLESEGVHVIYGMPGLKTHSKILLVVRREKTGLNRYVHIATGNYNPATSKLYTDLGLLTSDAKIGNDASDLFNFLTGYSYQREFRKLLVAPFDLREQMIALIDRETQNKLEGHNARIIVKLNSLTDEKIARALYRASQAGVKIDLIVRGICVLRPGIPGLSENIRVISIVGRFLEHSRVFYFMNRGEEAVYIGSADWMHRNLDRRVEAVVPVQDKGLIRYIRDNLLEAYLMDTSDSRLLKRDGTYTKKQTKTGQEEFDAQMYFVGHSL